MKKKSEEKYNKPVLRAAEILRFIREVALADENITQNKLADMTHLSQRTIIRMEAEESLSWETIRAVFLIYMTYPGISQRFGSLFKALEDSANVSAQIMELAAEYKDSKACNDYCNGYNEIVEKALAVNYHNL